MTDNKDGELKVVLSDQIENDIAADPELKDIIAEFIARMHQAHDAVLRGQYKTMDDAIEAITGIRPVVLDPVVLDPDALLDPDSLEGILHARMQKMRWDNDDED